MNYLPIQFAVVHEGNRGWITYWVEPDFTVCHEAASYIEMQQALALLEFQLDQEYAKELRLLDTLVRREAEEI